MDLLTRSDVAKRLGVSVHKAAELMQQMQRIAVGGRYRVSEESLEAWIRDHTLQPMRLVKEKRSTRGGHHVPHSPYLTADGRIPNRREMRELQAQSDNAGKKRTA